MTLRRENFGLARQWYEVWQPASPLEVAFVFEDDIEVSKGGTGQGRTAEQQGIVLCFGVLSCQLIINVGVFLFW